MQQSLGGALLGRTGSATLNPMSIRSGEPRDVEVLAAMMRAFHAEDALGPHPGAADALVELLADPRLGVVMVDEDGGAIVGYSVVTLGFSLELGGRDAFVDELYVTPERRRQGRGAALLASAMAWARTAGARAIHLEVALADEAKLRLYRSAGFEPRPHPLMICRL
jgi:GNAT superfamily N-acetyltransferase